MFLPENYQPEFESLKTLMVDMAEERSLNRLLSMIVERFATRPHLALARLWLIRPGDRCDSCELAHACARFTNCLHLVASAGRSIREPKTNWSRIDGKYSRIPIGHEIIGEIAATGEPAEIREPKNAPEWFTQSSLFVHERLMGFSAQPMIYREEVLGVLAIFVRITIPEQKPGRSWLRLVADQAASAIANARAFDEIERLRNRLEMENAYLREEVREAQSFEQLIGQSPPMEKLRQQIELVAPTDASVLILGDTGTGKELAAREIHRRSLRKDRPLIKVNCASVPRELWESEFFGHVKGAFTGAIKDRAGRFELADEGTLFLDEVGEIPFELQSRLLRVVQEGQFERVGDEVTRRVNVRIISATNKDLHREVREGRFRRDLYYRLNVFPIEVAPLSDRREDIASLIDYFIRLTAQKFNRPYKPLPGDQLLSMMKYNWPGNVRELQNVVERAMITRSEDLRLDLFISPDDDTTAAQDEDPQHATTPSRPMILSLPELKRREAENIRAALEMTGWKIYGRGGAAELLEVKPTTLASKVKKLGLKPGLQ